MISQRRHDSFRWSPSTISLITIFCSLFLLLGGRSFGWGAAKDHSNDLALKVSIKQESYQPGEAVLLSVELVNNTGKTYQVRKLNAESVQFFFGRMGDPERMERSAIASKAEPMGATASLGAGKTLKRDFLLTRLTEFPGSMLAQAHYSPGGQIGQGTPKFYSNTLQFAVKGARRFERDPQGNLTKQAAIKLATAAAGGDAQYARAVFIEDEKGFYKWWVNVERKVGAGPAQVASYFVDPYQGKVWHQAKPFDPAMADDPHAKRPENMMPMGARKKLGGGAE